MTKEEIICRRLAGQHLVRPADTQSVARDLCGVQAQYLSHALHGLAIRCREVNTAGLVKSWTNRGTMYLFSQDDLPLFFHEGRSNFLRPVDTLEADACITAARKAYFADLIVAAIRGGTDEREELKVLCQQAGMTETEAKSVFDPWGGTIRALCEAGRICHKVQERKAFQICPPFTPMAELPACLELAKRYFTHFGPATIKDAAYFFGKPQSQVKAWLTQLPIQETVVDRKSYFWMDGEEPTSEMPDCLFLAGFDSMMLGYEKAESLFLDMAHLREIFSLAGIVRPVVLVRGQVVGWWNLKNRKLKISLFDARVRDLVADAAAQTWRDLREVTFDKCP